ncbi:unnamed protein product, partial [Scytosiphon promiscuus]
IVKGPSFEWPLASRNIQMSRISFAATYVPDIFELLTKQVDITPELVRKTAGLAQIQITDEEVNSLVPRMEEFLGFVETMEEVYKSGDGTFAALSCGHNFLRDDAAERFSNVPAVMENMPVQEASYLRVPKVGEDEG